MREQPYFSGSLFNKLGHRKYLNAAERRRFIDAARNALPKITSVLSDPGLERRAHLRSAYAYASGDRPRQRRREHSDSKAPEEWRRRQKRR